jgi:thiol-disulfide isomerase/thioredoxin
MQIGDHIPMFSLPDIHGVMWQSTHASGKVLVINFWSAECPWSQKIDESLSPYLKLWGERVLYAALASNSNEPLELLQKTATERKIPLVLLDSQQIVADLLNAQTTPHFFVFSQTGNLCYQGGFDDINFRQRTATQMYLVDAVNSALSGQEPDVQEARSFGCSIVRFTVN